MANLRRIIPFMTLILIAVLTIFCIVGAFLGAQRAGELANSIPATIFWIILTILLIVGLFTFEKLIASPGLLAAHVGAILILIGSMAGAEKGNRVIDKLSGTETIRSGYMIIPEGRSSNIVLDAALEKTIGHLPFSVRLRRFWIEYYPPSGSDWMLAWLALVPGNEKTGERPTRQHGVLDWKLGQVMDIPFTKAKTKVLEYGTTGDGLPRMQLELSINGKTKRVKLASQFDKPTAIVSVNEALQLTARDQDANEVCLFLYNPDINQGPPKDYKSDLSIIRDKQEVANKVIEVNDPLHYGGYHFYQDNYILDQVNCTILSVHSDRGLALVYLGFALLCAGAAWLFYVQWPIEAIRHRKHDGS